MLLLASQKSDLRRAHESLELGANPDAFDAESHDRDTPLIIASAQGNIELTKLLLKAGANVNMRRHASVDGATPLMVAAQGNRAEIMQLLIDRGANVPARMGRFGAGPTALHYAVAENNEEACIVLLAAGAIVERRDLLAAMRNGSVAWVEQLLEAGADPRWIFETGRSVLQESAVAPVGSRTQLQKTIQRFLGRPSAARRGLQ